MGYFVISLFKRCLIAKMILSCLPSFKMNSTKELSVLTFTLIYSTLVYSAYGKHMGKRSVSGSC